MQWTTGLHVPSILLIGRFISKINCQCIDRATDCQAIMNGHNHRRLYQTACDRVAESSSEKTSVDTMGSTIATIGFRKTRVVFVTPN
jgi:hypothetical protein